MQVFFCPPKDENALVPNFLFFFGVLNEGNIVSSEPKKSHVAHMVSIPSLQKAKIDGFSKLKLSET
jgi:hypothetical protein